MADGFLPRDVERLIELWQGEEDLWKVSSEGYRRKDVRQEAMERIRRSMERDFTVTQLSDKMKNIRCYYARELNKARKIRNESGTDEIYVSKWPYFSNLDSFLRDQVIPRQSTCPLELQVTPKREIEDSDDASLHSDEYGTLLKRRKPLSTVVDDNVMESPEPMFYSLHEGASSRFFDNEDDDILYGKYIASEMRKIEDPKRKALAKVKIQTVLFEAQFPSEKVSSTPSTT